MLCHFAFVDTGEVECTICGLRLSVPAGTPVSQIRAVCTNSQPCIHLGELRADPELIPCETCKGRVRVKYPVHQCEIHGLCLPTYTGDQHDVEKFTRCRGCQDYAPLTIPAT